MLSANYLFAQANPGPMPALGVTTPWADNQLMEPADLASTINKGTAGSLTIYNIGAVEDIKGAKHIGPVSNPENLEKLKAAVASLPKNTAIIIYCGCCPFTKCPNIRPAFTELTKEGFTNIKLLNLPKNLQANWIAPGYPLATK